MSDLVLLCPIYAAGEKKDLSYNQDSLAKLISQNSKTQVVIIKDQLDVKKYLNKCLVGK